MSQSTNSTTNKNTIFSASGNPVNDKMSSTVPKQGMKRYGSDEYELEPNTKKIRQQSNEKEVASTTPKAVQTPKFVSATTMMNNPRQNADVIPEISDEELLEMAIKFELENPQ